MDGVAQDLEALKVRISEEYVKSDEFSELVENTLLQAANERSEEKRLVYRDFLVGTIISPGEPYDDQIRFLKMLEDMQPDHVRVLRVMLQDPTRGDEISSRMQTLVKRLPDIPRNRLEELVNDLIDMRLVRGTNTTFVSMVTGESAEDLKVLLTPTADRFVRYIRS